MTIAVGILILVLSCIGNAELWVILVNRRHSLKYTHGTLRKIRSLHDIGLTLYPPFIIALSGLTPNGLLRGGTFAQLSLSIQWLLLVTLSGLIPFIYSTIRWQMRKSPSRLLSTSSEIVDVLKQAKTDTERLAVTGEKTSTLAKLPFNQIYQLDVNTKRIQKSQSSSSAAVKRVRIAHFSDVHLIGCPGKGFHDFVADKLIELKPDAFVFTGDLIDNIDLLDWAIESFNRMSSAAPGYFILGNHDWHLNHDHIRRAIENTGWVNLAESCGRMDIAGISVMMAGTEVPWMGSNPVVPGKADEDLRLLLSHAPDQRDFALDNDFDLMLCGHNHGGQVVLPIVGPVYSPSKFGVLYAGGMFEHGELLIHVSRGVAAKDPLRWNCRPEITLLDIEIS